MIYLGPTIAGIVCGILASIPVSFGLLLLLSQLPLHRQAPDQFHVIIYAIQRERNVDGPFVFVPGLRPELYADQLGPDPRSRLGSGL